MNSFDFHLYPTLYLSSFVNLCLFSIQFLNAGHILRCCTTRGSSTRFTLVGSTTLKARKSSPFTEKLPCSSIHVYLFCLHVVHFSSAWMTSCVQFEKIERYTCILLLYWKIIQRKADNYNEKHCSIRQERAPPYCWVLYQYSRASIYGLNNFES